MKVITVIKLEQKREEFYENIDKFVNFQQVIFHARKGGKIELKRSSRGVKKEKL